jgi:hypothetical protein
MISAVRLILAAALAASAIAIRLPAASTAVNQTQPGAAERATLRLHYVQKPIGYERYEIAHDGDTLTVTSEFDFTDRGGRVQLASTLRTKADFSPLSFKASCKSYRFVNVDSAVPLRSGTDRESRRRGNRACRSPVLSIPLTGTRRSRCR